MNIVSLDIIDSTNKFLKDNYNDYSNFTFISANEQTKGKGREFRTWESNKNENLLFSLLVKEELYINSFDSLSICTAVAISKFLESEGFLNVSIKWPNDVYVNEKKICGILLEGNIPEYLIIGVGLNVNQVEFLGNYRTQPTSMAIEHAHTWNIVETKLEVFKYLLDEIKNIKTKEYIEYFNKHNFLKGKQVKYTRSRTGTLGTVINLNENNELIVDLNGVKKGLHSGEIEVIH